MTGNESVATDRQLPLPRTVNVRAANAVSATAATRAATVAAATVRPVPGETCATTRPTAPAASAPVRARVARCHTLPASGNEMNKADAAKTSIAASGPNRTAAKIAGSSEIETLTSLRRVTWPRSPYVATIASPTTAIGLFNPSPDTTSSAAVVQATA